MKIGSLFTGIGAWEKALKNIGIDTKLQWYAEIDKYASKAYSLIHNDSESKNIGDITKVDETKLDDVDMIVYSPPCQAFSVAGKMEGVKDKRGILFFDALRIIREKMPQVAVMENVKGLTTKKFKNEFAQMFSGLEMLGYKNYWKVLNTKNHRLPQNRERVFVVSILGEHKPFEFPKPHELKIRLKDILEDSVDEKYYLKNEKVKNFIDRIKEKNQEISYCIDANYYKGTTPEGFLNKGRRQLIAEPKRIGNVNGEQFGTGFAGNVWDKESISPTLTTMQGGGRQPMIIVPRCGAIRGRYKVDGKRQDHKMKVAGLTTQELELRKDDLTNTITTIQKDNVILNQEFRIRKLTPKECWRLQGFEDKDIDICIENGISNTQLYKQAGNSISVTVVEDLMIEIMKCIGLYKI